MNSIKPGWKTTEFWLTIILSLWAMVIADVSTPWNVLIPTIAVGLYGIARGLAKAGFIGGDVGKYLNKAVGIFLVFMLMSMVTVSWAAVPKTFTVTLPTTNSDGSPLTDLTSIIFYCGNMPNGPYPDKVDVGLVGDNGDGTLSHTDDFTLVPTNTVRYCVATASDGANESVYSNQVRVDFLAPDAPVNLSWSN